MKTFRRPKQVFIALYVVALLVIVSFTGPGMSASHPPTPSVPLADDPSPPAAPVKLIFVHHSTGGNWLADVDQHDNAGGLGRELMNNNYYVSATNYGWTAGDEAIGDNTDIGHWWEWFRGSNSAAYMSALYAETGQNIEGYGSWPRLPTDPGGENEIVMFKSCYPNSHLGGNPGDPPTAGANPLRGQDAWAGDSVHNVANAKGIYNDILEYFSTRQDKLFVVITAPPLLVNDGDQPTDAAHAANARAFNDWLVHDWLDGYPHDNVAVFDFYNVLTSNGGDPYTNDAGSESGNHHRWWNGAVQHVHPVSNNFSSYAVDSDSHPLAAGGQKATAEFVSLLNVYYNRWRPGGTGGGTYTFDAVVAPTDATPPITYHWSPEPTSGQGTASATYQWGADGVYDVTVEAENCGGTTFSDTHTITVGAPLANSPLPLSDAAAPVQQAMAFQDGVSPDAGYAGTSDVILAGDADDNANLGGLEDLQTYYGDAEYRRSLMRWDISALPGDVTIDAATVELYRYDEYTENPMQLALYRVTSDWVEGTGTNFYPGDPGYVPDGATWLTATTSVAWTTPGGDYDNTILDQLTIPMGTAYGWIHLDATAAVQDWVEEGQPNYGLLLRPLSGEWTDHMYHSREVVTSTLRPRLVVTYTPGAGGPALALTAPSAGTSWPVSSTQQIQWNTTGTVEQVNLSYSNDGFGTSDTIALAVGNSGFYTWTTPITPTQSARVRVESVVSPTVVYDVSEEFRLTKGGDFFVYQPLASRDHVLCTRPLTGVDIELATRLHE